MMIIIGSDHSGFRLKDVILKELKELHYSAEDLGEYSDIPSDYPDIAKKVTQKVLTHKAAYGILICGTGIGMSIAANRIPGIRAAHCTNTYEARMSREHNNANILCLGERVIGEKVALDIVRIWLETEFTHEERHIKRIKKIDDPKNRHR